MFFCNRKTSVFLVFTFFHKEAQITKLINSVDIIWLRELRIRSLCNFFVVSYILNKLLGTEFRMSKMLWQLFLAYLLILHLNNALSFVCLLFFLLSLSFAFLYIYPSIYLSILIYKIDIIAPTLEGCHQDLWDQAQKYFLICFVLFWQLYSFNEC